LSAGSPGVDLVLNAVQPRHHHGGKGKVRIGGGVGEAHLDARALGLDTHGTRIEAERLRAEYASITGASNPGTRRL
jgi:hypothetical protein